MEKPYKSCPKAAAGGFHVEMLGITPEAFERYCGKTTEDVKAAFQTPLTEREQLLFRILSLKGLLGSLHNRAASIEMLEHK